MKVLWLCNVMMPMIAEKLDLEASNKEGWISGLAAVLLKKRRDNGLELAVAFAPGDASRRQHEMLWLPGGHQESGAL